ncbi:MAG: hypothetical protein K0S41_3930 [Anaerocolumna sp.]|jgi:hypothetical protein|nr:hypothetical protein [Anaerocolumna sp.]
MGMKMNNYAVNQADKGTVIYSANESIDSICIVLKGRVLSLNDGVKILLGSGSFLGISDMYNGKMQSSYIAYDDVTLYCFPINNKDELSEIFNTNKDYKGLTISSLSKYIAELEKVFTSLKTNADKLYNFIQLSYTNYIETGKKLKYTTNTIDSIKDMEEYYSESIIDDRKLAYYKEASKTSLEIWKGFCNTSDIVTFYLIDEMTDLISWLNLECINLSNYISKIFDGLMNSSDSCLFKGFAALAISIEEQGGYNNELIQIIDNIIDQINIIEKLFDEKVGKKLFVDRNKMEEIYYLLLSNDSERKEQVETGFQFSQDESAQAINDLNNSFSQIMLYAGYDPDKAKEMEKNIIDFINLKDKNAIDDNVRLLRRKISSQFYEIYELVFFKAMNDKNLPRVIDLFLKYAFLDERLFTKEQLKELYYLNENIEETSPCKVYNIKDWLMLIYSGKKEPSKNEFDLDYTDMLRERRKKSEITEAQEKELLRNLNAKVTYEIQNMFRYNHRIVNGQITTFVPFLWGEELIKGISKLIVTAKSVNQAVTELLEIDYSAFYREVLYVDAANKIAKEYIMKDVYPDIVLMPTAGSNGVMWQEISGKRKNSEGRFFLPIFCEVPLRELMVKLFGRFRWELCRSIQGTSWNNIKYKSLTSEYADYIQFYRKNRDLSEEAKEKLKTQIQKGKGNYREIFLIDYEAWIKGESSGALRLNKVAREIIATYCPFKKDMRMKLANQPLFSDAMERYNRNTMKKLKELESRYRALEKDGIELTEELMETLMFYRDL